MSYTPQDNRLTGRRYPKGACSICDTIRPLRDDGTIRKHRHTNGVVCIGTGFLPARIVNPSRSDT